MPKINTAYAFDVALQSQADTKLAQTTPTLAVGDVKVTIDDGSQANITTLPTSIGGAGSKWVKVSLSAAEMNGSRIKVMFSDVAGAEWCDLPVTIDTSVDDLTVAAIADGYLDRADGIETGLTPRQAQRLIASVLCGTTSGGGTAAVTFKSAAGTTTRLVATVTTAGNRTGMTLTP